MTGERRAVGPGRPRLPGSARGDRPGLRGGVGRQGGAGGGRLFPLRGLGRAAAPLGWV